MESVRSKAKLQSDGQSRSQRLRPAGLVLFQLACVGVYAAHGLGYGR
jgi:hypothetical protein